MVSQESIGYIAAAFTMAAFFPQALQTLITKQTASLSLMMLSLQATGNFLWIIYGLSIQSSSVMLANIITFSIVLVILISKLYFDYRKPSL